MLLCGIPALQLKCCEVRSDRCSSMQKRGRARPRHRDHIMRACRYRFFAAIRTLCLTLFSQATAIVVSTFTTELMRILVQQTLTQLISVRSGPHHSRTEGYSKSSSLIRRAVSQKRPSPMWGQVRSLFLDQPAWPTDFLAANPSRVGCENDDNCTLAYP